jgi:siroheme synthase-like protein
MTENGKNTLYPIFLKLHQMQTVIVGGGEVGLEKISFMLKNSPDAKIKLIAKEVFEKDIWKYQDSHTNVTIEERAFKVSDLESASLLVLATNDIQFDEAIVELAHSKGVLCNVADKPELCDFYLGSIISRGDLKIAISTNGKSPTLAKRIRQYLEHALPDNTQEIIDNLSKIRNRLKGDFKYKVKALGNVTKILADTDEKYLEN